MTLEIDLTRYSNLDLKAHDDGVWVVTLNRPTKRNALDIATIEELVDFFSTAPRAGVKAVVLAGSGDHFCAGLDLIVAPLILCMFACAGTRRSTRWNTVVFR